MSKEQSSSAFKLASPAEVPGLSYWLPEAPKAEKSRPEPLTALEQMFAYYG